MSGDSTLESLTSSVDAPLEEMISSGLKSTAQVQSKKSNDLYNPSSKTYDSSAVNVHVSQMMSRMVCHNDTVGQKKFISVHEAYSTKGSLIINKITCMEKHVENEHSLLVARYEEVNINNRDSLN